jgi:hypothetical protein
MCVVNSKCLPVCWHCRASRPQGIQQRPRLFNSLLILATDGTSLVTLKMIAAFVFIYTVETFREEDFFSVCLFTAYTNLIYLNLHESD